ncbi:PROTEIN IWS1-like protein 1 [Salix purpurea]|uniref:PROTEIN IWS1-like protein 1 n=1 Tax=Salix purpurea TaxID=77065 RepID=A0A9Q0V1D5_SALPP|nr:PROTEIN IWS1-like protein 1 [Salix purpurea]
MIKKAEEGEEDDEIKRLFKMGKRRKKNEKSPAEIALLVENVMAELEVTAEEDANLNRQGKPAVNKLKKLPLLTEEAAPTKVHRSWKKDMTKDDNKRFENSLLKNLDTKLGDHLSEASSEEDFTGKLGQSMVLRVPGHGAKRIGFIVLGKSAANAYAFRNFARRLQLLQRMLKPVMLALCLPQLETPHGS